MIESTIERVARALSALNTDAEDDWESYLSDARAAIEAMRVPPRDVLTAFVDAGTSISDAETRWEAAIDTILKGEGR